MREREREREREGGRESEKERELACCPPLTPETWRLAIIVRLE
jgi:hypothetical protein